jgi:hypothetical protein
MKTSFLILLLTLFFIQIPIDALPYKDLLPHYSRTKSLVMARVIDVPSRANLDFATYSANPIRFNPEKQKPKKPAQPVTIKEMIFKGALKKAVSRIEETPLTKEEIDAPLAWAPLMNLLWTEQKADGLKKIGATIISEKWGDPDIFMPYQDIAALYLHRNGDKTEFWVKIEFMPWVSFLKGIGDVDKDGFREIYGRLNTDAIDVGQLATSVDWIVGEYQKKICTREEMVDWANVLASYWYPTLNTDIVDMSGASAWPTKETERNVRKYLKGLVIKNPVSVIRGNPYGKVLYNVFAVNGLGESAEAKPVGPVVTGPAASLDTAVSTNFRENNNRFTQELKEFGDYSAWSQRLKPVHDGLKKILAGLPKEQMGIQGADGWLFFRKSIDYILAPDLSKQEPDKNPLPRIQEFKAFLDANGVNFLFVAVPCKEELYCEKSGVMTTVAIIAPYGRKFLVELQNNGIEVIDLLPRFLEAKAADALSTEQVYQRQDTHWTNRGLQIAANSIADRIRQYRWYDSCSAQKVSFTAFDTTFLRQGDIVERIPEAQRINYQAAKLDARQIITPEGKKFKSDPAGPIVLIGDSYTGVFELVDCKSAGVGANIAEKTGLPVDILTSWGGGPMIMNKMVRLRKGALGAKRLVIYMMTARDLYNYSQGWEKLKKE